MPSLLWDLASLQSVTELDKILHVQRHFLKEIEKRGVFKNLLCTYHALQTVDLHVVTHGVVLFRQYTEWPNVLYIHQHLQG